MQRHASCASGERCTATKACAHAVALAACLLPRVWLAAALRLCRTADASPQPHRRTPSSTWMETEFAMITNTHRAQKGPAGKALHASVLSLASWCAAPQAQAGREGSSFASPGQRRMASLCGVVNFSCRQQTERTRGWEGGVVLSHQDASPWSQTRADSRGGVAGHRGRMGAWPHRRPRGRLSKSSAAACRRCIAPPRGPTRPARLAWPARSNCLSLAALFSSRHMSFVTGASPAAGGRAACRSV